MRQGRVSGIPWHIEYHYPSKETVNTNPNCGCVYRDYDRICHNRKSYDFTVKCHVLTHCPWRIRGIYNCFISNKTKFSIPPVDRTMTVVKSHNKNAIHISKNKPGNVPYTQVKSIESSVQVGSLVALHCKMKNEDYSFRIEKEKRSPFQEKCLGKRVGFIFGHNGYAYEIKGIN